METNDTSSRRRRAEETGGGGGSGAERLLTTGRGDFNCLIKQMNDGRRPFNTPEIPLKQKKRQ